MKRLMVMAPMLILAMSVHAELPGDSTDGKRVYDANCTGCHDASVYTRQNRSIRSLDALQGQLESCGHVAKKEFSATETQNLVKYLNDRFYHFQ